VPDHRSEKEERRRGSRKAPRPVVDPTPVLRSAALADGHVPRRRPAVSAREARVDPTRVTGPIRFVLEPMLWIAFAAGVVWLLVALDPGVRDPESGVLVYRHAFPLAVLVGTLLVISTVTALMWLPTSTTAARARTSFAGLGMLASGWLFATVDPVDTDDFLVMAWLSIAIGVLLVAVCAVPWPTTVTRHRSRPGLWGSTALAVLGLGVLIVSLLAWETAQRGLVGRAAGVDETWQALMPLLGVLGLLVAGIRLVLRLPTGRQAPHAAAPAASHHAS
jgi:hypothetical protein